MTIRYLLYYLRALARLLDQGLQGVVIGGHRHPRVADHKSGRAV